MNDSQPPKKTLDTARRILVGRRLRTANLEGELLPKAIALPIFSSDPLSSVAYGPQELLMILTLGGAAMLGFAPGIAAVVVLLLLIIILSYRRVIAAYPSGGGDYEVAKKNIGERSALIVASALLLDYVMTVAVSIASGVDNLISAFPAMNPWRVEIAVAFVLFLCAINLRGVRESGVAFAVPTYLFIASVLIMLGAGIYKLLAGLPISSPSADYHVIAQHDLTATPLLIILLILRSFASGSAALTGVEAIANGVPAFRLPKVKNAQKTMTWMGAAAITMFSGIIFFSLKANIHYLDDPVKQIGHALTSPQQSVLAQLGIAIFGDNTIMFFVLQASAAAILLLAANTAFNGFPLLSSVLAKDAYAPKSLMTRGDRLVYSNGMLSLTAAALVLLIIYKASVTDLIQLYVLGVFTSFTVGQLGMLRHWKRGLADGSITAREANSGRIINGFGAFMTASVLVIVTITKFTHGAWLVFIIMPTLYWIMYNTGRYYKTIEHEVALDPDIVFGAKGDYAVVLMDKLNLPQLKALDYAISSHHSDLDAIHVAIDPERAAEFQREWKAYGIKVPLKIIESPYREFTAPLIAYLEARHEQRKQERISIYLPKYVVGHWWEHIFHNHRANRLRRRLMYVPHTMVTIVPWRLRSAERFNPFDRKPLPGDMRRGENLRPAQRKHEKGRNAVYTIKHKEDEDE